MQRAIRDRLAVLFDRRLTSVATDEPDETIRGHVSSWRSTCCKQSGSALGLSPTAAADWAARCAHVSIWTANYGTNT